MDLAQGQTTGWGPTQWVAALAVAGSLAGVWLGKTLESRNHKKLQKATDEREQKRALDEALAQSELLYLRLDPQAILTQVQVGLLPTEMELAEQVRSLRQQADQVQDLLVRLGVHQSSEAMRSLLASLERSLRETLEELLLILVTSFKDLKEQSRSEWSAHKVYEGLQATYNAINQYREALGLDPTRIHLIAYTPAPQVDRSKLSASLDIKSTREIKEGSASSSAINLLDLTPMEFESLISHLVSRMGFESVHRGKQEAGADIVAFNPSPFVGGKVIIQVKRYRGVVSMSQIRDLYGVVLHEGASRGILITTSYFGRMAYEFASDKSLELVDGPGLLQLLAEHTDIKATIGLPKEDGRDSHS
jgi:HJR/Mrr/RecB family endonuclease